MRSAETICDWFAVSQVHMDGEVGRVCDGVVTCYDPETGDIEWETHKYYKHTGSFDTSIRVRSDGNRVELSGNVGRYGRMDNVFGYSVDHCKEIANGIMRSLQLPEFNAGKPFVVDVKNQYGEFEQRAGHTGAVISQIHLTRNFSTGSDENKKDYLYWLTTQKCSNTETTHYGRETVYFGERSKYQRTKCYCKSKALKSEQRRLNAKGTMTPQDIERRNYLEQLIDWTNNQGLVRLETELKSRYLTQLGINHWTNCNNESMNIHYEKAQKKVMGSCTSYVDLEDLSARAQDLYYSYLAGVNLQERHNWSTATFYRYRKELKAVGIDICRPVDVEAHKVRPRLIELTPAVQPEFYKLPEPAELLKAA